MNKLHKFSRLVYQQTTKISLIDLNVDSTLSIIRYMNTNFNNLSRKNNFQFEKKIWVRYVFYDVLLLTKYLKSKNL